MASLPPVTCSPDVLLLFAPLPSLGPGFSPEPGPHWVLHVTRGHRIRAGARRDSRLGPWGLVSPPRRTGPALWLPLEVPVVPRGAGLGSLSGVTACVKQHRPSPMATGAPSPRHADLCASGSPSSAWVSPWRAGPTALARVPPACLPSPVVPASSATCSQCPAGLRRGGLGPWRAWGVRGPWVTEQARPLGQAQAMWPSGSGLLAPPSSLPLPGCRWSPPQWAGLPWRTINASGRT